MWRERTSRSSQFVDPKINHCTDDNEKPVEYNEECSPAARAQGRG
jgi:hypothetical protein